MPNNVTDSPRDEEKWEKAEGIAKKQLGHAPKSDNDWAYVMGIYKKMKPDHQFQSEKSASKKYDHKEWDSSKKKWIYHYDHSAAANSATDKARKSSPDSITHPANPKLKGNSALHVMHTDAAHHAQRNGDHKKMKHHQDWAGYYGKRIFPYQQFRVTDHHNLMAEHTKDTEKYYHHKEMAEHSEMTKYTSTVVEKWLARRVATNFEELMEQQMLQDFYRSVERKLIQRPKEATFGGKHIYLWFSERFSGGWHIDFEANVRTDGRRIWMELQGDRRRYTNPAQAAKAINARRDLEIEENDPGRYASDKEARAQTMRLDNGLKAKVNRDMRNTGLDGNGRFRKPQQGYSLAVEMMQRWNLEIDGTAHSHLFNTDSGKVTVDIAMTNTADRFSPFPITNSMLVVQFHKLEKGRYEVIAYLS